MERTQDLAQYREGDTALNPAQVCVIGSGAAGSLVAVALAQAGIDTVLLESGASLPDYDPSSLIGKLHVGGKIDLRFGFSREIGGSTNLWAGRMTPLETIDFTPRPWVPESGWPLSFDDLSPYYQQANKILNVPDSMLFHFDTKPLRRAGKAAEKLANCLEQKDMLEAKGFQWAPKAFHAADYLCEALKRGNSLRFITNAQVISLTHEGGDGKKVSGAEILLPDGRVRTIGARIFILAAGGLETPRILFNSRSVHAKGIGNLYDNVGRYFSTHPKADMAALILNRPVTVNCPLFTDQPTAKSEGRCRYGLGFSFKAQTDLRLLNHYVQLSPLFEYRANQLFETIKGSQALQSDLIDRSALVRGILPGFGHIAYEAISRMASCQQRARKFILRGFLDQYPNRENRVCASLETDRSGIHKIDMHWTYTQKDRDSVLSFFRHMDRVFRSNSLGRIEYAGLESNDEWPLIGVHSHFMGTTRMGNDPKNSVTDKNAKVHGIDNLYVAGPSLFPTYGYANPVYNIAALSLRLADHVKNAIASN